MFWISKLQSVMGKHPRHRVSDGGFVVPTVQEVLDDLCCKFIVNIPEEELLIPERIFFQAELAHWFYEDFYREKYQELSYYSFKSFCKLMFEHCPALEQYHGSKFDQIIGDFVSYKNSVPVSGAVLLNANKTKCLMIKGWSKKSQWGFPKGKMNEDEGWLECAIREVKEEIGFDISSIIQEKRYVEYQVKNKTTRLYIVQEISEGTLFTPQTKREIGDISWHSIKDVIINKNGIYGMTGSVMTKVLDYFERSQSNQKLRRLLELVVERIPIEKRRALLNIRMNKIAKQDVKIEHRMDLDEIPNFPKLWELTQVLPALPNPLVNKLVDRERILDRLNGFGDSMNFHKSESSELPKSCLYKDKELFKITISNVTSSPYL